MRAVIYARFSSEKQTENSIDAQLRACKEYAERKNLKIVNTFIDRAKSGTTIKREAYQSMLSSAINKEFQVVIIHKLDRLGRNLMNNLKAISLLEDNGVRVESVTENFTNDASGRLMRNLLSSYGQFFSEALAVETMKGLKENAYNCLHTGGQPPLGYDVVDKKYVINETEAEAVRLIYRMTLEGETAGVVIKKQTELGYKNKVNTPWTKNSLISILRNEKYKGFMIFNKTASKDSRGKRNGNKKKDDKDIIRVPNGIPAIIDEETFNKVQELLESRKKVNTFLPRGNEYLLSGMVICDVCGSKMYPNIRRHTNKNNPNRKPKSYASFRCNCRKSKTNIVCNNSEIKIEYLDEFVLGEVTEICSNDKIRAELTGEVNKAFIEEVNEKKKSIKLKESELKSLDKKINNILVALENGINSEDIVYRLEEIKANKKTLQDELEYIKNVEVCRIDSEEVIKLILNISKYIQSNKKCIDVKILLRKIIKEIRVGKEEIKVIFNDLGLENVEELVDKTA